MPPKPSGVAAYAASLLPRFDGLADVVPYVDQAEVALDQGLRRAPVHQLRFPREALGFDAALYQLGNSEDHAGAHEMFLHYPGIVHLHDLVLHHFHLATTFQRGRWRDYQRRLERTEGRAGLIHDACVRRNMGGDLGYFELPLIGDVVARAVGLIVHTHDARRRLRARRAALPILRIPMPSFPPPAGSFDGGAFRARRGIGREEVVVAAIGFATPAKRIDRVVRALGRLDPADLSRVRLVVVGRKNVASRIEQAVAEAGIADRVLELGFVQESELWSAIDAADVVVNLRFPTAGEASAPLAQSMALGKPALVSALRQFLELPADAVVRIPLGEGEEPALVAALERLVRDEAYRRGVGARARQYALGEGDPDRIARSIVAFVHALAAPSRRALSEGASRIDRLRRRQVSGVGRGLERGLGRRATPLVEALGIEDLGRSMRLPEGREP